MAELVIVRPVHFTPGREPEAIAWAQETEPVRRRHGMKHQWILRGTVDQWDCLMIQVWQSEEAYQHWRRSEERARLVQERLQFAGNDATKTYRVL